MFRRASDDAEASMSVEAYKIFIIHRDYIVYLSQPGVIAAG